MRAQFPQRECAVVTAADRIASGPDEDGAPAALWQQETTGTTWSGSEARREEVDGGDPGATVDRLPCTTVTTLASRIAKPIWTAMVEPMLPATPSELALTACCSLPLRTPFPAPDRSQPWYPES